MGYYDMYDYGYRGASFFSSSLLICFILAVIGGIVLYFTFLSKKNENKFTGFSGWLYDFLSFKKLIIEAILKILYLILTCYMTLGGLVMLFQSFVSGLGMIIFGNILVRVVYEFALILILICKNTSEINKKMKGDVSGSSDMFVSSVELPKKPVAPTQAHPIQQTQNVQSSHTVQQTQNIPPAQPTSGPAFCMQCGKPVKENDDFCSNCGNKLK